MNANHVTRSGERRQKYIFFLEEVRRMGTDRRRHGKPALWESARKYWHRIFGTD